MKAVISAVSILAAVFLFSAASAAIDEEGVDNMLKDLHWLGHSSFRLDGPRTVYFDPLKLPAGSRKADIIFISHEHFDHCSLDDIRLITAQDTVIVCDKSAFKGLKGALKCKDIKAVSAGDKLDVEGISAEVVPSYNIGKKYHPKGAGYVGYIVTVNGVRFYHAGDTDMIPEMKDIRCDIALLPVGGTYTMDAEEASEAALLIKPKAAIPMHYGDIVGTIDDAARFTGLLKGKIEARIMDREGSS